MTIHTRHREACGCDRAEGLSELLSFEDALALCEARVDVLAGVERVALVDAVGRCLAEPVVSQNNSPPFTNSAVDGYAVHTDVLEGDGPWVLPVSARIAAGDGGRPLERGSAARIFTGAPLPAGANAVVMQEDVTVEGQHVQFGRAVRDGENIRHCGEDLAEGEVVLQAGHRMSRRDVGLVAAAGASEVVVRRPVRVALLVTGSEVVDAGQVLGSGQINDVNGPMLQAAMAGPMVEIVARVSLGDSLQYISAAMASLAEQVDLVVTTGGVSVGEEDYLHRAFAQIGGQHRFAGVAVKPGKPISFGQFPNGAYWLGLPGNPTAAYVGWHVFGRVVVSALQGLNAKPRRSAVALSGALHHKPGRSELRPAQWAGFDAEGRALVSTASATHSGRVGPLAGADGVLIIPAQTEQMPEGALVEFLPFDDQ